ncbi:MAG TPA: tetratricopeptide repeat protein [Dongiaceae bacterium]|nr:tetratricopeptide repeat protein [Dongiaceae bacterium]
MRQPHPRFAIRLAAVLLASAMILPAAAHADGMAGFQAFERGDYATALKEFQVLADQGVPAAQAALGQMYLQGLGVQQDYATAAKWLTPAATHGNAAAQAQLSTLYLLGLGVAKDEKQSAYWTKRAADHGVKHSQVELAAMYYKGVGVPQDLAQAYFYADIAARANDPSQIMSADSHLPVDPSLTKDMQDAASIRDTVAQQLPQAQVQQLKLQADAWKPSLQ